MKTKEEILDFVEYKINNYAKRILEQPDNADRAAMGELNFYVSLRNVIKNSKVAIERASLRDLGLMDSVNDTLIFLGIIPKRHNRKKVKFYDPKTFSCSSDCTAKPGK